MLKKLDESVFLGGLFGAGATVPWEGEDYEKNMETVGNAIATDADGAYTFIEGGKNLAIMGGAEFNTANQTYRIRSYREMQYYPEVDEAIDHIIGDMITNDPKRLPVELDFTMLEKQGLEPSSKVKEALNTAHEKILKLCGIAQQPTELARSFYVDGKQAFQIILNKDPKKGINRMVKLDSASIYKVKMIKLGNTPEGIQYVEAERDAYLYDAKAYMATGSRIHTIEINQNKILELPFDSVAYADSCMYTPEGKGIVGFMEPAVKAANNLNTVEDSTVIYSITRAVDKRAVYVDVGDLPTKSAESVLKRTMEMFRTKLNYNQATGEITGRKKQLSMNEDYYLARRDGKNVAEVQTLDAARNINDVNHVQYFKEKVYTALKIPRARARENSSSLVNIGGSPLGEQDRAEYNFGKHVASIRQKYSEMLKHALKVECIQTNVMTAEEWNEIKDYLMYEFVIDNYIIEQQQNETFSQRMALLREVEPFVGKLFSIKYVEKNVLKRSDDEIELMQQEIEDEQNKGMYNDYGETPLQLISREERLEREEQERERQAQSTEPEDDDLPDI